MTKDEAEKELTEILSGKIADWFCPLIKDKCNTDCICFSAPYKYKSSNFIDDEQ